MLPVLNICLIPNKIFFDGLLQAFINLYSVTQKSQMINPAKIDILVCWVLKETGALLCSASFEKVQHHLRMGQ